MAITIKNELGVNTYVNVDDIYDLLNQSVTKQTIRILIKNLKGKKLAGKLYVNLKQIEDYLSGTINNKEESSNA